MVSFTTIIKHFKLCHDVWISPLNNTKQFKAIKHKLKYARNVNNDFFVVQLVWQIEGRVQQFVDGKF